jgi:ABC-type lipoprotein export system ATPase subunit
MILSLERISKSYQRADGPRIALDCVSLQLERGQIMGIFGPSGAGKTTLLRIAAGLENPDSGAVAYKGEPMSEMSEAQRRRYRRREVGCVWSGQPWSPGLSVLEHVELPLLVDGCEGRLARRTAEKFLLACEAEQCSGLSPAKLSEGERQRVAIARALVIEPRLLLVDGALAGLSLIEKETTMVLLSSLAAEAKVAVLVADTGASDLLGANPILYLRDGKLIGEDPVERAGKLYTLPSAAAWRSAADA